MATFADRSWLRLPVLPPASVAELDSQAAPRRLVLVGQNGDDVVLSQPPASQLHAELTRQMAAHPGQRIAGEWLGPRGWVRFIEGGLP